jgi:HNH endonuclease
MYAIVPTFYHWIFPHDNLPNSWKNIESPHRLTFYPQDPSKSCCIMTLNEESVEMAHLIPVSQRQWFNMNQMAPYTASTGTDKMKHPMNMIKLRSDIHTIFDAKRFTIVPKKKLLMVHTFSEKAISEVFRLYHNVPIQQFEAGVEFLFARFAYTVFEHLRTCLESGEPKKLRLRVGMGMEERDCVGRECAKFAKETASRSTSRSASPKKRQRGQDTEHATWEEEVEMSDEEEEQRGRKRRRLGEEWWSSSTLSYRSTDFAGSESTNSLRHTERVAI